jgi:hypothetical protein
MLIFTIAICVFVSIIEILFLAGIVGVVVMLIRQLPDANLFEWVFSIIIILMLLSGGTMIGYLTLHVLFNI